MITAALERKAKLLQRQVEYHLDTITDINKTMVGEIVRKASKLSSFSLFDLPNQYFNKFTNFVSGQLGQITNSVNFLGSLHDKIDSIGQVASSAFSGLTGSVSDFSSLLNNVTTQMTDGLGLQNTMQWPSEWVLNNPANDPHADAINDGWQFHSDTNTYTKKNDIKCRCLFCDDGCNQDFITKSPSEIKNKYSTTFQETIQTPPNSKPYCKPGWESFCKEADKGFSSSKPSSTTYCKPGWESFCSAADKGFGSTSVED